MAKPKVYLIANVSDAREGMPVFSLKPSISPVLPVDIYEIPEETLKEINHFVTNISSISEDKYFLLLNTFSANMYLSSFYIRFLQAWRLLEILKIEKEISLLVEEDSELLLWEKFFISNSVEVRSGKPILFFINLKKITAGLLEVFTEYFLCKSASKKRTIFSDTIFIHWINQVDMSSASLLNNSQYFGSCLKDVAQKKKVSILGHVLSGHRDFNEIIQLNFSFIKEYIFMKDILWAFCQSIKIWNFSVKNVIFKEVDYSSMVAFFVKKDFWDASFLKNLLFYRAFKRIFKVVHKETTIFYPFENQPWEKALLIAAKQAKKKIVTNAYQFFPISRNFLIYAFSEQLKAYGVMPSKILVSDRETEKLFKKHDAKIFEFGNMRYADILNANINLEGRNAILCALFLDAVEAIELTNQIVNMAALINHNFVINYHPLLHSDVIKKVKQLTKNSKNILISSQKFSALLKNAFVAIYNSSSVCMEAALNGTATLYLPCQSIINLDRLSGLGKAAKSVEDAVCYVQNLLNDEKLYRRECFSLHKKINEMIITYDIKNIEKVIK